MPRQRRPLSPVAQQAQWLRRRNLLHTCLWIIVVGSLTSLVFGLLLYFLSTPR